jgi:Protein of unknown function (DUF1353)
MKGFKVFPFIALIILLGSSNAHGIVQFLDFVRASPFGDGEYWFLIEALNYEVKGTNVVVTVPAGFVTDMASIPRPFWSILPRWGKYGPPAVVHDYLYWDQRCTQEQADAIMLLAMEETGVNPITRFFIKLGLNIGGFFAWQANQDLRKSERVRIIPLDKFDPADPTLEWSEYQEFLFNEGIRPEPRPDTSSGLSYCSALGNALAS